MKKATALIILSSLIFLASCGATETEETIETNTEINTIEEAPAAETIIDEEAGTKELMIEDAATEDAATEDAIIDEEATVSPELEAEMIVDEDIIEIK